MQNRHVLSIIICNYNYEIFVGQSIESALEQTYPWVEVICVDDGSTDESRNVIDSFGNRIKKIYQTNGGQGAAMASGLMAASGEVVIFLDSDDMLYPGCAEKVMEAWRPDYASMHFGIDFINFEGRKLVMPRCPRPFSARGSAQVN